MTPQAVRAPLDDVTEACRGASSGTLGAGDIVWSRDTGRAACTLVLEPDIALSRACQMGPLALVAVAETLGHLCPPQVGVEFRWPGAILVNGGLAGSVHLTAPVEASPDQVPRWLAVSTSIDLVRRDPRGEPGTDHTRTALAEEGAPEVTRSEVISALAVRLLAWIHTWGEDGFRPIHDQWLFRAEGRDQDTSVGGHRGRIVGLDEDAGLMLRSSAGPVVNVPFLPHLRRSGTS